MSVTPVKSAVRVLEVLDFFRCHQRPAVLKDICEALDYPQSSGTVRRFDKFPRHRDLASIDRLDAFDKIFMFAPIRSAASLGSNLFPSPSEASVSTFSATRRGTDTFWLVRPTTHPCLMSGVWLCR